MITALTPLAFYRRAEELFGSKIGVVDGEVRLTYAQFAERVDRLSGALDGLGVGPGDVVSFLTYNTHQKCCPRFSNKLKIPVQML